jgi:hypothetical protein
MMSEILRELTERMDEDLPPYVLQGLSVDVAEYRSDLDAAGLAYIVPASPHHHAPEALERSAVIAINKSVRKASVVGAAGGLAGFLGVPPEAAARVLQSLRLAQRLAIIYGHDPTTDKGAIHVRRALACAWDFELPQQANVDMRLSDLPTLIRAGIPAKHSGGVWITRTMLTQATAVVGRRITRIIPGLGIGLGAIQARRSARTQGDRMHQTFLRSYRPPRTKAIEDAVEV